MMKVSEGNTPHTPPPTPIALGGGFSTLWAERGEILCVSARETPKGDFREYSGNQWRPGRTDLIPEFRGLWRLNRVTSEGPWSWMFVSQCRHTASPAGPAHH